MAACVGGGSNAIGIFHAFLDDPGVRLVGMEAGGDGIETGRHASTISGGTVGVLHGARSFLLQDDDGQIIESHSISAGLDYPGVGPEHAHLAEIGRAEYRSITDTQAMDAFALLSRTEGIIPAIESAHAVAGAVDLAREIGPGRHRADQRLRARGQGHGDRDALVRPGRADRRDRRRRARRSAAGRRERRRHHAARTADDRAVERCSPTCGPRAGPRWSATCRPATRRVDGSTELLAAMIDGGCDLVEVGLPFSDPVLDGPVIQHAAQTALAGGFRIRDLFGIVESVTAAGGRAVVMTYFNPVLAYGVDAFARDLAAAGGSGVITPDLIVDEAGPWLAAAARARAGPDLPGRAVVVGRADRADRGVHQRVPVRGLDDGRDRRPRPGVGGRAGTGGPLPGDHRPADRRRARGPHRRAGRARSPGSPTR